MDGRDRVDLRWVDIVDMQAPFGQNNGSTYWFHRNEEVEHRVGLYHVDTTVLAEGFPNTGHFLWSLSDGSVSRRGDSTYRRTER